MPWEQMFYIGLTTIIGALSYFARDVLNRLNKVEDSLKYTVTQPEVRQIVADKLDPIKEDLAGIDARVSKILDILIHDRPRS